MLAIPGLGLHRLRVVVRDKPTVDANAQGGNVALVNALPSPSPRQLAIFENAPVATTSSEVLPRASGTEETPAVCGDTEEDLLGWEPVRHEIGHGGRARGLALVHSVELGVVAARRCPRSKEIVRHEVDIIEIRGRCSEVDELKDRLVSGQSRRENEAIFWKADTDRGQESDEILALLGVIRVFPCN